MGKNILVVCLLLLSMNAWGQFAMGSNTGSLQRPSYNDVSDNTDSVKRYYADKADSYKKYAQYALCSIPVTALIGLSVSARLNNGESGDIADGNSGNVIGMATGIASSLLVSGVLYCVGLSYEHRINNPRKVDKYRQELAFTVTPHGITISF